MAKAGVNPADDRSDMMRSSHLLSVAARSPDLSLLRPPIRWRGRAPLFIARAGDLLASDRVQTGAVPNALWRRLRCARFRRSRRNPPACPSRDRLVERRVDGTSTGTQSGVPWRIMASAQGKRSNTTERWQDKGARCALRFGRVFSGPYAAILRGAPVLRSLRPLQFHKKISVVARCAGSRP